MKKPEAKSYALRIDAQLVKPLQELKKQNRRSLNAEINAALENWIVRSRSADAERSEVPSPTPPAPVANSGSRASRKPSKKQLEVRAEDTDVTPEEE